MSANDPVRLGILSTANIGITIINAVKPLPTISVTTVASRSLAKAEAFASKYSIPSAVVYEDLLSQPIDAVYIPLPTALVPDWAVRCAEAGFHVIADKPFASAGAVRRILDACDANNVMFMDATHFVHSTRTGIIRRHIDDESIGKVRRVEATLTLPLVMEGNIRTDPELEPMGGLGDLGWYTSRAIVSYVGAEKAKKVKRVSASAVWSEKYKGCLVTAEGVVEFEGEERLTLCFAFDMYGGVRQSVHIDGMEGAIGIEDFVLPINSSDYWESSRAEEDFSTDTEYTFVKSVGGYDENGDPKVVYPKAKTVRVEETDKLTQPSLMMREFARIIVENDFQKMQALAEETLATQRILDKIWELAIQSR